MAEPKPITTRNTFAAVARSIVPTIKRLDRLPDAKCAAVVGMILTDADRIAATIEQDETPDWLERELRHIDLPAITAALEEVRDAYSGRTLQDMRAEVAANKRILARITGEHAGALKVAAALESTAAELEAFDAPATKRSR